MKSLQPEASIANIDDGSGPVAAAQVRLTEAGIALVERAAEDCRAAGLDGAHDLQADGVEQPGPGLAIGRSRAAEDLRHAGFLRHLAASGREHGRPRERMVEGREHPAGCARVAPGGIGLPVTERVLYDVDAAPALMHVGGK